MRLQKARQLLEQQKVGSVKEIAYSVGFKHTNYFSQLFKERFRKRPSEYV
jgi:transcriptional regulator GlxA family with amidase domain